MDNFFTALEDADIPQEVIEMIRRSTQNGTRRADDTIEQLLQDLISGIIVAAGRST
jgi:predicted hydrolase (HD superfamily)